MESFHAARAAAPACEPRLWSLPLLEASRERVLAGDLKSPLKRLLGDADLWLTRSRKSDQLFTVTTKPATPSVTYSCSLHCFYSLGTYWWPNNATPDGLPYVRDDGLVNPDTFKYDSIPLSQMLFAVSNLSLAYFFTANRSYAAGAAAFVDTFFFDQETYMDASVGLEHSQAVPGVPNDDAGRGTGIIDAKDIAYALDSACLLPTDDPSWGANRTSQLRSWMGQYWGWMNHSHHSVDEFSTTNNHGTWYDVQALSLALHLADAPSADFFAQHILSRISEQISSTGELPQETSRTRPLHYTWWDLQAFFEHAWMAQSRGVPAFNYTSPSGGSLRKALEWVLPYAIGVQPFPEPELTPFDAGCFFPILRMAQRVWPEAAPKFEAALRQLPTDGMGYHYSDSPLNLIWPPLNASTPSAPVTVPSGPRPPAKASPKASTKPSPMTALAFAPPLLRGRTGGGGSSCTTEEGTEYLGNDLEPPMPTEGADECCAACAAMSGCAFFTYEGGAKGLCHLKNANAPDYSRMNASVTSGYQGADPPTPAPAGPTYSVRVLPKRSTTSGHYVCWNIDASENREFFVRNYSTGNAFGTKIARQASALAVGQESGFAVIRFGGTGNDYLTYEFGGTKCPPKSEYKQCLNESTWRGLLSFTEMAQAKIIVGLSMNTENDRRRRLIHRASAADGAIDELPNKEVHASELAHTSGDDPFPYPWDPKNARELLEWTIANGLDHLLYGVELGNEQNTKYSAVQIAHNTARLYNLTLELWPDDSRRPRLFGPDPHSLHDTSSSATQTELAWMAEWLSTCETLGLPIFGVTHHEYSEVEPSLAGFTAPTRLALSESIAEVVNKTVRDVSKAVGIWGGEIGPHNAGSPACSHASMRWAVFGDSFWYADALAAKARHGYASFCRQDYIGADYGMVDCSTGTPLPDFFTALIWTHVMGPTVLGVTLADDKGETIGTSAVVRAAVHCVAKHESSSTPNGGIALMMINLSNRSTTVHLEEGLGGIERVYVLEPSPDAASSLTGVGGIMGTGIRLNGNLLTAADDGTVARPTAAPGGGGSSAPLPAYSIAFFVLPHAFHPDCPWA